MDSDFNPLTLLHVCRLHRKLTISYMRTRGITSGQPPLLEVLWKSGGCTQSELAHRCQLEPATITSTLTTMERDGLVERRSDPSDRRVWRISLTERGLRAHQACRETNQDVFDICFDGFSEEETAQAMDFMCRMTGNIEKALLSVQNRETDGTKE